MKQIGKNDVSIKLVKHVTKKAVIFNFSIHFFRLNEFYLNLHKTDLFLNTNFSSLNELD